MFCPNCGTSNPEGANQCSACQAPMPAMPGMTTPASVPLQSPTPAVRQSPPLQINNYLVPAIITTVLGVLCCISLPFGITALVFATQANTKNSMGDYAGAMESARMAKIFCWIAAIIFVAIGLIYVLLFGAAFMSELMKGH